MPAVVMRDFHWRYASRKRWALEGINLTIPEGAFVGVVGANEAGKTTLVSAIKGLIPNNFHGVVRGTVEIFGREMTKLSGLELARDTGMVFSDPEAQFTAMTVEEELVFGLENIGASLADIKRQLEWVTEITMIGDLLDKSPYEISGGQKQRVAIAAVLAMRPRIIILDEPTSMLDPFGKEAVFKVLESLKRERELTVIVVEHNIEELAALADQMILVSDGKVERVAPPAEFFADVDFLEAHDVYPPQATEFIHALNREGLYSGPIPINFEEGLKAARSVLNGIRPAPAKVEYGKAD